VRIAIYGAGAVGGYLAGFLARGGADVSVLARGAHLAAIQADGLRVETPSASLTVRISASDNPARLGPQNAVLVTVKAPGLPEVARRIGPLLGQDTTVAFIMNGVPWWYYFGLRTHRPALLSRPPREEAGGRGPAGTAGARLPPSANLLPQGKGVSSIEDPTQIPLLDPDRALERGIGPRRVVGGVFWPACSVPRPGVVRLLTGAGRGTSFGEPDGTSSIRLQALAGAFHAADLPVTLSSNIRALIWHKLVFNLSAGPMCVLTESAVQASHAEPALIATSRALLAEAMALAAAMGFPVEIDVEQVVAANMRLAHRPSILQDFDARRRMEIDALYTVPLQMARAAGVPMPTLGLLASLIRVKAGVRGLYP
jgi:2-dehydropantoate 2-reductase